MTSLLLDRPSLTCSPLGTVLIHSVTSDGCGSPEIAARVTVDNVMPDGTTTDLESGASVLLISYEDDLSDTIRPRLSAAGANMERILALPAVPDGEGGTRDPELPRDLPMVEEIMMTRNVKLLIVDPLMAGLSSKIDSHKDQDVRKAMTQLKNLAERTRSTVLVVRHLNKSGGGNAVYRGGGSIGIIGAARAGLMAMKHPEDESKRLLSVVKMNVGVEAPSLVYRLAENEDGRPYVMWEGESPLTANQALRAQGLPELPTELERATAFLLDFLADGPQPATSVVREAGGIGVSERTLDRAKPELVTSTRKGFGSEGEWQWTLASDIVDNDTSRLCNTDHSVKGCQG